MNDKRDQTGSKKLPRASKIAAPILVTAVGVGWLLTVQGIIPGVQWAWVLGLAGLGAVVLVFEGVNKFSFVVGPALIVGALLSILRQSGYRYRSSGVDHHHRCVVDLGVSASAAAASLVSSRIAESQQLQRGDFHLSRLTGVDRRRAVFGANPKLMGKWFSRIPSEPLRCYRASAPPEESIRCHELKPLSLRCLPGWQSAFSGSSSRWDSTRRSRWQL
jgi:hypothetical protein